MIEHVVAEADDSIVTIDSQRRITYWNQGAARTYGWSATEAVGADAIELLSTDPVTPWSVIEQAVATSGGWSGEVMRRTKSGEQLLVDSRCTGIDGSILLIDRDLTPSAATARLYRRLIDEAPDAMVCVDAGGVITIVNARAIQMLGYTRDELIGRSVEILVPEGSRRAHPPFRDRYLRDPRPRRMGEGRQLSVRRGDGSTFPAEISLNVLDTGHGVLVSAAIRDLTDRLRDEAERDRLQADAERERAERRVLQSHRLESLGQLAGGVAHDFNNLMSAIGGYAGFVDDAVSAAERGDTPDWTEVRTDLSHVLKAVERAASLTRQLLAFARQEVAAPAEIDLNDVVRDIEELLRRTLGDHIELRTICAVGTPVVLVDRGQIEQVLVNLAVNARDAMPDGGRLTIETSRVDPDPTFTARNPGLGPGPYAQVRVIDEGTGMTDAVAQRVFEPFFTTRPRGEGSGLGLATAYGIITQADGDLHVRSEPGKGSTFTVLLPAIRQRTPTITTSDDASRGGTETVLVLDDEDGIREVARRVLSRVGYTVLTAATGADALRQAEEYVGTIHLLLTDVVMPEMLGPEVAARLTRRRPDVQTLYMSGYAEGVLGTGAVADIEMVGKPFSADVLLAAVRRILDDRSK